jgi:hypothetical protein
MLKNASPICHPVITTEVDKIMTNCRSLAQRQGWGDHTNINCEPREIHRTNTANICAYSQN